jgi:Zn-dependent protease with chaperone function
MDLFLAQDDARRRAAGMFTLAMCLMAGVVAVVHLLVVLCVGGSISDVAVHRSVVGWTLPATIAVLLVGVVVRVYALRLGGSGIAEELGGRRLHPSTKEPGEMRLVGMVEELALSSGIPVPEVWLLEGENSINAFAAGHDPSSAVLGVTMGALERLSVEELRAVLLHEFSHILSGDMQMRFQMLVWVQGILFLTLAGRLMIASDAPNKAGFWGKTGGSDHHKISGGRLPAKDDEGQSRSVIGLLLMVLGFVSGLFGRFLQAAISRDREFAADESSANALASVIPVANALRKIGGLPNRSWLENPTAPESGHLFFGASSIGIVSAFFPTHPTLEDRIRRLNPEWNGDFLPSVVRKIELESVPRENEGSGDEGNLSAAAKAAAAIGARKREKLRAKEMAQVTSVKTYPAANLDFLGLCMQPAQLLSSGVLKRTLKAAWLDLTHSTEGVKVLLVELLKAPINAKLDLGSASTSQMLLLMDLAMPMFRRLSVAEYFQLMKQCRREVVRPEAIDVVRFLLLQMVRRRIGISLGVREVSPVVFEELPSIWQEARVLISSLLRMGAPTQSGRSAAHLAAWSSLGYENPTPPLDDCSVVEIVDALEVCEQASPLLKKRLLVACGLAASYQGTIPEREMAIVRLCADVLGCPVPHLSTGKMEVQA